MDSCLQLTVVIMYLTLTLPDCATALFIVKFYHVKLVPWSYTKIRERMDVLFSPPNCIKVYNNARRQQMSVHNYVNNVRLFNEISHNFGPTIPCKLMTTSNDITRFRD